MADEQGQNTTFALNILRVKLEIIGELEASDLDLDMNMFFVLLVVCFGGGVVLFFSFFTFFFFLKQKTFGQISEKSGQHGRRSVKTSNHT